MCGRYYVDDETTKEIEKIVRKIEQTTSKRHTGDVYPSQQTAVLFEKNGELSLAEMQWGFPQYQKKGLLINARSETVLERKMFRESVLHRRCIIAAKHFYEWDAAKNKIAFQRKDAPVLYMAGFYNKFEENDHFIIITTGANQSVRPIHDRMPLILESSEIQSWIYDNQFLEYALHKQIPVLERFQEYEQQTLLL